LDRINIGILNKSLSVTQDELYKTAIHEAGHAMVALLNSEATPLDKVTILSKGGSLGHTSFLPERDSYI
jgi:ATP-dependent Zn protease